MQTQQLNTTSVYRRLSQLTIAIALLILLFIKWIDTDNQGRQLLAENHAQLTQIQVAQSAQVAAHFIVAKQNKPLTRMLNDLKKQPFIVQAMAYDHQGKVIARSANALTALNSYQQQTQPFDALTPINQSLIAKDDSRWFVSEIRHKDRLIGYLRVNYQQQQALIEPTKTHRKLMEQILVIGLISGMMGYLLTRGFSRFSRNSFRIR